MARKLIFPALMPHTRESNTLEPKHKAPFPQAIKNYQINTNTCLASANLIGRNWLHHGKTNFRAIRVADWLVRPILSNAVRAP